MGSNLLLGLFGSSLFHELGVKVGCVDSLFKRIEELVQHDKVRVGQIAFALLSEKCLGDHLILSSFIIRHLNELIIMREFIRWKRGHHVSLDLFSFPIRVAACFGVNLRARLLSVPASGEPNNNAVSI